MKVWRRRIAAKVMRRRVVNRDFTIISNDCWGGMAYEELAMRYDTPFVGLFVVIEDYMRLLRRPQFYCEAKMEFATQSRRQEINSWREAIRKPYPIGVLNGDVEVHFVHYASRDEAETKWMRRARRIHWENLLVKVCWHDDDRMEDWLREFDGMAYAKKISLVPNESPDLRHAVRLRDYTTDGSAQYWSSHRHFDVAAWLNRGVVQRTIWTQFLGASLYWHH